MEPVPHRSHYIPERRSQEIDVIEDAIPLYDVRVSLRTPRVVREVLGVPVGESIPLAMDSGRVEFTVPRMVGHRMVAVHLKGE